MSEWLSEFMKNYSLVTFATLFGALAHALEKVSKKGWGGWIAFISDMLVCAFVGFTFFNLAIVMYPESINIPVVLSSLGSYWGTKGFSIIRDWAIKSVKANINNDNV